MGFKRSQLYSRLWEATVKWNCEEAKVHAAGCGKWGNGRDGASEVYIVLFSRFGLQILYLYAYTWWGQWRPFKEQPMHLCETK